MKECSVPAKKAVPKKPSDEQSTHELINGSTTNYFSSAQVVPKQEVPWTEKWADPVSIFTALLVLVSAIQGIITWRSLRDSKRAAEAATRSAKAANVSAQLAVSLEVPRLALYKLFIEEGSAASPRATIQSPKVHVQLKNYGKTTAFLESQGAGTHIGFVLPTEPTYAHFAYDVEPENVVEANGLHKINVIRPWLRPDQIEGIIQQKLFLWVYGYIQYKDFLGQKHITRFCKQLLVSALEDPQSKRYQFSEAAVPAAYLSSGQDR